MAGTAKAKDCRESASRYMTVQTAIEWCKERGVTFEMEGDKLIIVGADNLSPKAIDRLREIKSEIITALFGNNTPPVDPKVKFCETCGAMASHGLGAYPWRGVEGAWFCAEHVPPRERIEIAIIQNNEPTPTEPKQHSRFLKITNIVTGVTTTIDLHAKQQHRRVERSKPHREPTIIDAERVNQDMPIPQIDYQLLQDIACIRNQYAEQECETDRFCRCGNLAQTQWRLDSKLVWMCDECF